MGRTYVVIADEVLSAIDRIAGKRGRSRLIEDAAREKLARIELEEALRVTAGVAKGKRYGHWADRAAAAACVRQVRRSGDLDSGAGLREERKGELPSTL